MTTPQANSFKRFLGSKTSSSLGRAYGDGGTKNIHLMLETRKAKHKTREITKTKMLQWFDTGDTTDGPLHRR